jgi:hypothetical protein
MPLRSADTGAYICMSTSPAPAATGGCSCLRCCPRPRPPCSAPCAAAAASHAPRRLAMAFSNSHWPLAARQGTHQSPPGSVSGLSASQSRRPEHRSPETCITIWHPGALKGILGLLLAAASHGAHAGLLHSLAAPPERLQCRSSTLTCPGHSLANCPSHASTVHESRPRSPRLRAKPVCREHA